MPPHNDLPFFRLKVLFESLVRLYRVNMFGIHILYGHFNARYYPANGAVNNAVVFGNRQNPRCLRQTKNIEYFYAQVAEKLADIFW